MYFIIIIIRHFQCGWRRDCWWLAANLISDGVCCWEESAETAALRSAAAERRDHWGTEVCRWRLLSYDSLPRRRTVVSKMSIYITSLQYSYQRRLSWLARWKSHVLKTICNDFLVVKVNCPSYVFNISKSVWILRNIKKLGHFRKSARKCAPDDLFTFASGDVILGKQTREQAIGVLSETLHCTTLQ